MKFIAVFILFCSSALAFPKLGGKPSENVEPGKAPFIVALEFCFAGICELDCTGVILNENLILTSAWCAQLVPYNVFIGVTNLPHDNHTAQYAFAVAGVLHPKYNKDKNLNDIGIIKLEKALKYGVNAQAVTLPKQGEAPTADAAEFYGYNQRLLPHGPLMVSRNQKLISLGECKALLEKAGASLDRLETSICTASAATGEGDRGGPLIQNGKVIGIIGKNITDVTVDSNSPGVAVFTPTNLYADWINEVKKSKL